MFYEVFCYDRYLQRKLSNNNIESDTFLSIEQVGFVDDASQHMPIPFSFLPHADCFFLGNYHHRLCYQSFHIMYLAYTYALTSFK